jgi:hypothetical protein
MDFLAEDVAIKTALLTGVVITGGLELFSEVVEHDGRTEDAREGMLDVRILAPLPTMHKDGTDLTVAIKVLYALAVHPENSLDLLDRHGIPCCTMIGMFDKDLAGATARHPVEHSEALALYVAFDLENRGTLWNNSDEPFRTVSGLTVGAVSDDLWRSDRLLSRTEWACSIAMVDDSLFLHENPALGRRVLP